MLFRSVIGAGEAQRYLRATFNEFKRLADHTVIVGNNISANERQMIAEYGFELIEDYREWGTSQHKIKQDLMYYLAKYEPTYLICLDGDEVFDPTLTREKLIEMLDKYIEDEITAAIRRGELPKGKKYRNLDKTIKKAIKKTK